MAASLAPDVADLLEQLAKGPQLSFRDMPVDVARAAVVQMGEMLDLPPDPGVEILDALVPADGRALPIRFYTPPALKVGPTILYLHGGGWVVGSIQSYDSFCRFLAQRSGLRVASLDYRLAPETPFPGAFDDAAAAAHWLTLGNGPFGVESGLVLAGDSAGGNLAAALARASAGQGWLRALLLFYPVLDLAGRTPSYAEFATGHLLDAADMGYFIDSYVPDEARRQDPRCSPLRSLDARLLPPVSLLTCSHDVLRDEGRAFADACTAAGTALRHVEAEGHIHGLVTLRGGIASGEGPINEAIDALEELLGAEGR